MKVLVNKSENAAFAFVRNGKQVTLGAGKKVSLSDSDLEDVKKQIELFDFLEIQELEEASPSRAKIDTVSEVAEEVTQKTQKKVSSKNKS
jgi:hypothetical protein